MGLNRMMMKNSGVKVEDGSKTWEPQDLLNVSKSFTVPPHVKRIQVTAYMYDHEGEPDASYRAEIANMSHSPRKIWGSGYFQTDPRGNVLVFRDINSIVGVTPNKTYTLFFSCYDTYGVTFSWGKAINDMKPIVEDY